MSVSFVGITKKNIWQYYENLSNFKVKCRFCIKEYYCVAITNFSRHVRTMHRDVVDHKDEELYILPSKFFKYSNKGSAVVMQCIICNLTFKPDSELLTKHLRKHSMKQLEDHSFPSWSWKYCIKSEDYQVKCYICNKNINLNISRQLNQHLINAHIDVILENKQKTYNTSQSSGCVLALESNTMPTSSNIAKQHSLKTELIVGGGESNSWLTQYYIKLSNFRVQCKACPYNSYYIDVLLFKNHIDTEHASIALFERSELGETSLGWQYLQILNIYFAKCVICGVIFAIHENNMNDHMSKHSKQERQEWQAVLWPIKYFTKIYDLVAKCKICEKIIKLSISHDVIYHIINRHLESLKRMLETDSTTEQSGNQQTWKKALINIHQKQALSLEAQTISSSKRIYETDSTTEQLGSQQSWKKALINIHQKQALSLKAQTISSSKRIHETDSTTEQSGSQQSWKKKLINIHQKQALPLETQTISSSKRIHKTDSTTEQSGSQQTWKKPLISIHQKRVLPLEAQTMSFSKRIHKTDSTTEQSGSQQIVKKALINIPQKRVLPLEAQRMSSLKRIHQIDSTTMQSGSQQTWKKALLINIPQKRILPVEVRLLDISCLKRMHVINSTTEQSGSQKTGRSINMR
ncbi:uncharacterized protein [Linepithema humile]|uniref:uncharacterized protein isoform X3 n=1 Tax=Linepithema humile TaxID=83485 RepID=UPI00351E4884